MSLGVPENPIEILNPFSARHVFFSWNLNKHEMMMTS